jgi:hypothetical protein
MGSTANASATDVCPVTKATVGHHKVKMIDWMFKSSGISSSLITLSGQTLRASLGCNRGRGRRVPGDWCKGGETLSNLEDGVGEHLNIIILHVRSVVIYNAGPHLDAPKLCNAILLC